MPRWAAFSDRFRGDYEVLHRLRSLRYRNERHLPGCLADLNLVGRQVLEIGLGEGADAEQLIRHGARW
jgi:hypothetical protein